MSIQEVLTNGTVQEVITNGWTFPTNNQDKANYLLQNENVYRGLSRLYMRERNKALVELMDTYDRAALSVDWLKLRFHKDQYVPVGNKTFKKVVDQLGRFGFYHHAMSTYAFKGE